MCSSSSPLGTRSRLFSRAPMRGRAGVVVLRRLRRRSSRTVSACPFCSLIGRSAGLDLGASVVIVCAYGLLIPEDLLAERSWLNVHPSLLPRWRGAAPVERAILAGDSETGVTIHETVKELDAGPVAAQEAFPIGEGDAGSVFERAAPLPSGCSSRSSSIRVRRSSRRAPKASPTPTRSSRPTASSIWHAPQTSSCGACGRFHPTSERAPSCTAARSRSGVHRSARPDRSNPSRSSPTVGSGWTLQPGCAVSGDDAASISPARAAAFEVIRRVFEDEAYADRALRTATAKLDERDRSLARQLAYGTVQRTRTLDYAIETIGRRPVRRLDDAVRAALRLGAFQLAFLDGVPRYAAVNESVELVRRARLERAVPFTNAVLPPARGRGQIVRRGAAGVDLAGGSAPPFLPGLGGRGLVARSRCRGSPRPDAGPERGSADRRQARAG